MKCTTKWKSEDVTVLMATNLTAENHKCLSMNIPGHIKHLPVTPAKLLILMLNLGKCAFLIEWTNRNTRVYISTLLYHIW